MIREQNKIGKDDFDGSLLPSYVYNTPSQPIYKKASDSLQMFKEKMFISNNGSNNNNNNYNNINNNNNHNINNNSRNKYINLNKSDSGMFLKKSNSSITNLPPNLNYNNNISNISSSFVDEREYSKKNNYMFDNKSYYLGASTLNHNTIINPINYDRNTNDYLVKFKQQVDKENKSFLRQLFDY